MRKNRLAYFLRQFTLTPKEFAAEAGIPTERLKNYDINPTAEITQAIVRYFAARNRPQEKAAIFSLLSQEGGALYLQETNLYEALGDYLSYAPSFAKHHRIEGLRLPKHELYTARCSVFRGFDQTVRAVGRFCAQAVRLRELQSALIVYSPAPLGQSELWQGVLTLLADFSLPVKVCGNDPLPLAFRHRRLLTAILPNHCLLEILDTVEPLTLFTEDAVRANGAYQRLQAEDEPHCPLFSFRMSYLFNLTGMRNDTLAGLLFIDKTLVSKFKNGKRRLKCFDDLLRKMAAALYGSGPENEKKLRALMSAYYRLSPSCSEDVLIGYLCKWLVYRDNEGQGGNPSHRVNYFVYLGVRGVKDAVSALLYCCRQIEGPLQLHVACFDHPDCLPLLDDLLPYLLESPLHSATVLLKSDFSAACLIDFLHRHTPAGQASALSTRLLLRGNLNVRFILPAPPPDCKIQIAVPGTAILNITHVPGVPDQLQTTAYYGKDVCTLQEAIPPYRLSPARCLPEASEILLVSDLGILGFLEKEELSGLFGATQKQADRIAAEYAPLFAAKQASVRCLLWADELERRLSGTSFYYPPLSILLGRDILLTPGILRHYAKKILRLIREDTGSDIRLVAGGSALFPGRCALGKNRFVLWDREAVKIFRDPALLYAAGTILKELLAGLPENTESRHYNIRQLSLLLQPN